MIKMKSHHPLLVNNEVCTEFETNEQHARELELAGLALRVESTPVAPEELPQTSDVPEPAVEQAAPDAPAEPAVTPVKIKKAK